MRKPIATMLAIASCLTLAVGLAAAEGHHGQDGNPGFMASDFHGTYADFFHGTVDGTGVLTADGNGNITSGTETVSDGTNVCMGTLTGTYTVNTDGTGTLVTIFTTAATGGTIAGSCPSSPVTHNASFVMTARRTIDTSEIDVGLLVLGHLARQHNDNGFSD